MGFVTTDMMRKLLHLPDVEYDRESIGRRKLLRLRFPRIIIFLLLILQTERFIYMTVSAICLAHLLEDLRQGNS